MATKNTATAEKLETTDAHGIRKVFNGTVEQVQTAFKDAEKSWQDAVEQLQQRVQGVEGDVREFVKKLETDGKARFETIKDQLKVDDLVARFKSRDFADFTDETIERFGLAKAIDITAIQATLDKLAAKVESVRKKSTGTVPKRSFDALKKRVDQLEKALKAASK